MKNNKKLITIIIWAIVGIIDATYLTYNAYIIKSHTKVFGWLWNITLSCDVNSTFSCSSIFNENFAWILWLPFSEIALSVYPILAIIAILWITWKIKNHFKILLIMSILWLIFNWYIIANEYLIWAYCLLCLICTSIIIIIWTLSLIWIYKDENRK